MGSPLLLREVDRRWLLVTAGRGMLGVAVLGLASACTGAGDGDTTASDPTSETPQSQTPEADSPSAAGDAPDELAWSRVDLGFVSAYVLVRGRDAAVVDTGVGGSAEAIGSVLADAGRGWGDVRHVVLTHKHPDHVGSVGGGARAGSERHRVRRPRRPAGRRRTTSAEALADGDDVLGLRIVATPGHTAGHLAVFDEGTGVLVAGDALNNDGRLSGSNPQFTEDEAAAADSVRALARLAPRAILVGHGAPVLDGAADALRELADSLG